jgi:hypothetical protein
MTGTPTWDEAKSRYLAARRAELAYDAEHILPVTKGAKSGPSTAPPIPLELWLGSERLMDLRSDAEDVLMDIPAPDVNAFVFKVLIAKSDGRETDCWDELLAREGRRFAPDFLFYSDALAGQKELAA